MTTLVGSVKEYTEVLPTEDRLLVGEVKLYVPDAGQSRVGNFANHDTITLSDENITSKSFLLSATPRNESLVMFLPEGGIPQFVHVDYAVSGRKLTWEGYSLDGFLEKDEVIHVYY